MVHVNGRENNLVGNVRLRATLLGREVVNGTRWSQKEFNPMQAFPIPICYLWKVTDSPVVCQVIGELANNHGVMRPFVQTFVLASQSAKKYYVHNDIFRYQDDVFHANGPTTDPGFAGQQNHVDAAFEEAAGGVCNVTLILVSVLSM